MHVTKLKVHTAPEFMQWRNWKSQYVTSNAKTFLTNKCMAVILRVAIQLHHNIIFPFKECLSSSTLCSPGFEFCMMPNFFAFLVLVYQTSFEACPAKVDKIKSTTLNNYCSKLLLLLLLTLERFEQIRSVHKQS